MDQAFGCNFIDVIVMGAEPLFWAFIFTITPLFLTIVWTSPLFTSHSLLRLERIFSRTMGVQEWFRREFLVPRRLTFNVLFYGTHLFWFAYGWYSQVRSSSTLRAFLTPAVH